MSEKFKEKYNINEDTTIYLEDYLKWQSSPEATYIMNVVENHKKVIIDGKYECFNGTKFINDSKSSSRGNLAINCAGGFL